jgi:hypothetical protein
MSKDHSPLIERLASFDNLERSSANRANLKKHRKAYAECAEASSAFPHLSFLLLLLLTTLRT